MKGFTSEQKLWCHLSVKSGTKHTNSEIRESPPYIVNSFIDLVKFIAELANENPEYSLFFRGQGRDYWSGSSETSSFYPTIFRKDDTLQKAELDERYDVLDRCTEAFIKSIGSNNANRTRKYELFPELVWSVLQHYDVCDTPLLDVTPSYRVAASFAYHTKHPRCFVFVFAVPYPRETLTYSAEEEMLLIKLQNTCPPEALRPHFQEGYLLGNFPSRIDKKHFRLDFGRRLIAKIEIPKNNITKDEFRINPKLDLYPKNDGFEWTCRNIKDLYNHSSDPM